MRKITFGGASSLDNYLARTDDAVDWLLWSDEGAAVMGGGELARSLFEADLIDEVGFNIHPVLLGSGIPAFHQMSRQINLELVTSRAFKNGCVLVTYRVKHQEGAA